MTLFKRSVLAATAILAMASYPVYAVINQTVAVCNPSVTTQCAKPDVNGALPVTGTFAPSGTQNVNVTQVGGNAVTTTIPISAPSPIPVTGSFTATTTALTNTVPPTYTDGTTNPLSTDLSGQLRVTGTFSANSTAQATTAAPSYTNGTPNPLSQDLSGNLRTIIPGGVTINAALPGGSNAIGTVTAVGNVASGATDSGNPLKVGGIFNTALPTFTAGQRGDWQFDNKGKGLITTNAGLSALTDASTNSPFVIVGNQSSTNAAVTTAQQSYSMLFNGTTWDRTRGDVNGTWANGNVASGVADSGNPLKIGAVFNTALPTVTNGQRVNLQSDANGRQIVTAPLLQTAQAVSSSGVVGPLVQGNVVGAAFPSYTIGNTNAIEMTNRGALKITPYGGASLTGKLITAASTNASNISTTSTILYDFQAYNNSATIAYLKFYNVVGTPVCNTDVPVTTIIIPASTNGAGTNVVYFSGKSFGLGLGICVTGGIADNDNTPVAANTVVVNFNYRN